jgi:hypothetical protein
MEAYSGPSVTYSVSSVASAFAKTSAGRYGLVGEYPCNYSKLFMLTYSVSFYICGGKDPSLKIADKM